MTDTMTDPRSLADRLDAALPPDRFDIPSMSDDPLVNTAQLFAALPQPLLSPVTKGQIRSQVLEAYRQQTHRSVSMRSRTIAALRWAAVVGIVLMLSLVGVTRAALASVPGDTLYPVKEVVERVELALATSDQARASVQLKHAERRAQEALVLLDRGRWSPDLVTTALDDMIAAAKAAREDPSIPASERVQLEARTVQINTLLDSILVRAARSGLVSQDSLAPLIEHVHTTQTSGSLLLPPPVPAPTATPSPTPAPGPTGTATPAPSPTLTATLAATPTVEFSPTPPPAAATGTLAPAAVVSPEASPGTPAAESECPSTPGCETPTSIPITIIIEGAVESIDGNIITIDGIPIEVAPDDPRLGAIQIGDVLRIEGESAKRGATPVIVAVNVIFVNADVAVGGNGQVWRDDGNCANPPPSWAPAHGWRLRCEGVPHPKGSHDDNRGDEDD
jgi:hypothetical protein